MNFDPISFGDHWSPINRHTSSNYVWFSFTHFTWNQMWIPSGVFALISGKPFAFTFAFWRDNGNSAWSLVLCIIFICAREFIEKWNARFGKLINLKFRALPCPPCAKKFKSCLLVVWSRIDNALVSISLGNYHKDCIFKVFALINIHHPLT